MSKRRNGSATRKKRLNASLKSLFKMSREQLAQRKTTGAGTHKTRRDLPRGEAKRRALNDQS